jgi:hypothetical protein
MPTVAESRFLELMPTYLWRLNASVEEIDRALDRQTQAINLLSVALYATSTNRNISEAVHELPDLRSLLVDG